MRRLVLPGLMKGGESQSLGARAMYRGGTLYRIHRSNVPETIGLAGAPICWDSGNTACFGSAAVTIFFPADILFGSGCTPPILNVFSMSCQLSCLSCSTDSFTGSIIFSAAGVTTLFGGKFTAQIEFCGHSSIHFRHRRHFSKSM